MENIVTLIVSVISIISSEFGIIWWWTARQKKQLEKEKVKQSTNETDKSTFENLKDRVTFAEESVNKLNYVTTEMTKKLTEMEKHVTKLSSIIIKSDIFHCEKLQCTDRIPELGEYHTEIPKNEERKYKLDVKTINK